MTSVLTEGRDNLRLQAELVLEAACKIRDAASPISSDVWHLADVVVHVTAGEEQNGNKAASCPDVAALDDGENVRPGNKCKCSATEQDHDSRHQAYPVHRPLDRRMRSVWKVSRNPAVDLLSGLGPGVCVSWLFALHPSIPQTLTRS